MSEEAQSRAKTVTELSQNYTRARPPKSRRALLPDRALGRREGPKSEAKAQAVRLAALLAVRLSVRAVALALAERLRGPARSMAQAPSWPRRRPRLVPPPPPRHRCRSQALWCGTPSRR